MPVSSMTGFGRATGDAEWGNWVWEVKSVNGRGLDARLNLPHGYEALDAELKRLVQARFKRGNLQMSLRIKYARPSGELRINADALRQLTEDFEAVVGTKPDPQTVATMMSIKGVVETDTTDSGVSLEVEGVRSALIDSATEALDALKLDRDQEGAALSALLTDQLSELRRLTLLAEQDAAGQVEAIRHRFQGRLAELNAENVISEDRIATEAAVLAAKADVSEETDRLQAHIAKLAELLNSTDEIGRQLGFLTQELNREANTLCSKSALLSLTETGLALKGVIDQLKEQSANVE